jgi:hypothetical protein
MQNEKTASLRLPLDLAHRIESRAAFYNEARRKQNELGGKQVEILNQSDIMRRAMSIGLDFMEGGSDRVQDLMLNDFRQTLAAMLALPATNPGALKLLKKIAATAPTPDPDFG